MFCIAAGFVICLAASVKDIPGVIYFGVFLAVLGKEPFSDSFPPDPRHLTRSIGIYPALPGNVTWLGNNLAGGYKRAAGMAIHIGIGNLGGG